MVKVKDEKICKKWIEEAIEESKKEPLPHLAYNYKGTELTPAAAHYIIKENRWLADQIDGTVVVKNFGHLYHLEVIYLSIVI